MRIRGVVILALVMSALLSSNVARAEIRAQVDTVGFAVEWPDMQAVIAACLEFEGLDRNAPAAPAVAAILPHDDYLYAGRTTVHALPHLQARRWIIVGVCHRCRRIGVRDQVIFDAFDSWRVAGRNFAVDKDLRDVLRARLDGWAVVDDERHAAEHSVESLVPWLGLAVDEPLFVPLLIAGMEPETLRQAADRLGRVLADLCRERGWQPGKDIGLLISADAVHYGCEGWGGGGYAPFGCDAGGHEAGRAQDIDLAETILAGPLAAKKVVRFIDRVWDRDHPDYPDYPYKITWCGLYSIPFGLTAALVWQETTGSEPLTGELLRYGDSVTDGRLDAATVHLGVTAPNTLQHWVGYPTVIYTAGAP